MMLRITRDVYKSFQWPWTLCFYSICSILLIGLTGSIFAIARGYLAAGSVLMAFSVAWFRYMMRVGWRWRVRDGNRLPMETNSNLRDSLLTDTPAVSDISIGDAWRALDRRGRYHLILRCLGFLGLVGIASVFGFSNSPALGVVLTAAAISAFAWFLYRVWEYVRANDPGSDPWSGI